jgi:hypothetical protein
MNPGLNSIIPPLPEAVRRGDFQDRRACEHTYVEASRPRVAIYRYVRTVISECFGRHPFSQQARGTDLVFGALWQLHYVRNTCVDVWIESSYPA